MNEDEREGIGCLALIIVAIICSTVIECRKLDVKEDKDRLDRIEKKLEEKR